MQKKTVIEVKHAFGYIHVRAEAEEARSLVLRTSGLLFATLVIVLVHLLPFVY